jgi:hypothetical protein
MKVPPKIIANSLPEMPLKRHENANKKSCDMPQKCKQNYLINAYGIDSGCIYCTGLGYLE